MEPSVPSRTDGRECTHIGFFVADERTEIVFVSLIREERAPSNDVLIRRVRKA